MQTEPQKLYQRKMPIFWWTQRWTHLKFILRELTSLPVAFFGIELILLVRAVSVSSEAYYSYLDALGNPILIFLNILALGGLVFHSITWFNLAPKAMVLKLGSKPIPPFLIAGSNYIAWIVLSVGLIWILTLKP